MTKSRMQQITEIPELAPRKSDAHKGNFGRVLVIAGSLGMSGAAAIVGKSALRAGAGLVKVATPRTILPIVAAIEPSFTTLPLPDDSAGRICRQAVNPLLRAAEEHDIIALGPGLGVSPQLRTIIQALISRENLRIVIDADGLNNLAKMPDWPQKAAARLILTPHPGEMKRLWAALFREDIPADRTETAARFAQQSKATILLKGAGTVVTDANKIYVNTTGNPGMATGGTGDVLTGVTAALWAQIADPFDAAVLAAYLHGLAGDIAAQKLSQPALIATDVIDHLPDAFHKL